MLRASGPGPSGNGRYVNSARQTPFNVSYRPAVVAEQDLTLIDERDGTFAQVLARARAVGAATARIAVGRAHVLERVASATRGDHDGVGVALVIPDTPFLLDPMTRVGVTEPRILNPEF